MIGQKFGPYQIVEAIGQGGMASVYRAYQASVERDVAVKVMHKSIANDSNAILRFQREARLIARLEHPHILPVYDFDGAFEPPYIVMRYLDSGTLKDVMKQGLLPHEEVNFLIRQVGSALDYAHRQGIIHRDVKPSNIMIDREGNAFVTDLGIARLALADHKTGQQITDTGAIVGTPDYMSPEQAQGLDHIDHRTDIYALGIVLFEMLTGRLPFISDSPLGVLVMHMNEPVPDVSTLNTLLTPAVDVVLQRVLAKDPNDRYQSAAQFAEAVTTVLGGTVAGVPLKLREAATTSIIRRQGHQDGHSTDSKVTPSEQNKTVTLLYANAAEYSLIVTEVAGSEPARRALDALWHSFETLIVEQEGQVLSQSDTELLAIWGADSAHEDDAERAIFTGLALQDAIRQLGAAFLEDDEPLPLNIGINSGLALLTPSAETGSYAVSGMPVNIAHRLMNHAEGKLLITHQTFRQVIGIFDISEDEPLRIRGRSEALATYEVTNAKLRSFHIFLRGIEGIETRMIGRRAELEHLQRAYMDAVEDRETQVVTVISEAGLGKSRLLYEFDRHPTDGRTAQFAEAVTTVLGGTVAGVPLKLREAATTSIIRRQGHQDGHSTDSKVTPSEQNKTVTLLYANAAEYSLIVTEVAGSEPARRALDALWHSFETLIVEQEGQVLSQSDTELLAIWGADSAHEDDAERAIFTGLALQDAIRQLGAAFLEDDEPLPLNIGINSGLALLTPSAETGSYAVSGMPVNIAHRLMNHAEGKLLITHQTFRQVIGIFDISEDEPLRIRGRSEALATYEVTNAKLRSFHIFLRGIEGIETRMIGRRAELEHLQRAYMDAVEDRETQVVTVISEAGLGKSRLLYEFDKWAELRPELYRLFRARAASTMTNRPYALIRDMLSFRFEIQDSDASHVVRAKLEAGILELLGREDAEMAHMMGYLAGFDLSDSPHIKGLLGDPEQLSQRAKQLFVRFFVTLAETIQPVVITIEDMHYADDASLTLLNELFVSSDSMQLLAVCLARPTLFERRPEWGSGQAFHTRIELKPLDKRDSRDLVREVLQKMETIPRDLRDLLVERSEGNPFYMEETVKMLLDDRVILRVQDEKWALEASRLSDLRVPATLRGLLETRLDTLLYPEKLTLQRAAVIGRVFYDTGLIVLDAADETHVHNLRTVLKSLVERDFIERRETTAFEGSVEYTFASNMLHHAIENALLERQIRIFNRAAADWLAETAGERVDEYLGLMAKYYEQGGDIDKAVEYMGLSAEKARLTGALHEAKTILEKALALISDTDSEQEQKLQLQLAEVYFDLSNYSEAQRLLQPLVETLRESKNAEYLAEALYLLVYTYRIQGEFNKRKSILDELMTVTESLNDYWKARAFHAQGSWHIDRSEFEQVIEYVERCLARITPDEDTDFYIQVLNAAGIAYLHSDRPKEAQRYYERALNLAQTAGNRQRVVQLSLNLGDLLLKQEHLDEAGQLTLSSLTLAREIGLRRYEAMLLFNLGDIAIARNQLSKVLAFLQESLHIAQEIKLIPVVVASLTVYARWQMLTEDYDGALVTLGAALNHPAADYNTHMEAEPILSRLRDRFGDEFVEHGLERGKSQDFDEVLEAFLNME